MCLICCLRRICCCCHSKTYYLNDDDDDVAAGENVVALGIRNLRVRPCRIFTPCLEQILEVEEEEDGVSRFKAFLSMISLTVHVIVHQLYQFYLLIYLNLFT